MAIFGSGGSGGGGGGGTGNVNGPAVSADGELVLFNGTTGKIIKGSSGLTGLITATAGVASDIALDGDAAHFLDGQGNFTTPTGGSGDVNGPVSSTNSAIARWSGTGGATLKDSNVTVGDSTGNIATPGGISTGAASGSTGDVAIVGTTSGTVHLSAASAAGGAVFQLLSTTGTHVLSDIDSSQTLTNKTFNASNNTLSNVTEAMQTLSDVITNNATTTAHGYAPKGDNNAAHFLNGQLAWATPVGGGDVSGPVSSNDFAVALWSGTSGDTLQDSAVLITPPGSMELPGSLTVDGDGIFITGPSTANIIFGGSTSGTVTLTAEDVAGTGTFKLPVTGTSDHTLADLDSTQTFSNKNLALNAALGTDDTCTGVPVVGLNAGATISQWQAVYLDSSSKWQVADANSAGKFPAVGLALTSGTNNNPLSVVVGPATIRNDAFSWTPGGILYLSETAGDLTQTAPSASGSIVQQVGLALTADIILLNGNIVYLTIT